MFLLQFSGSSSAVGSVSLACYPKPRHEGKLRELTNMTCKDRRLHSTREERCEQIKPESSTTKPNKTHFPFQDLQPDQGNGKPSTDFSELVSSLGAFVGILEEVLTAPASPELHRALG